MSFPKGICFCPRPVALASLVVIPEGNLLLPSPFTPAAWSDAISSPASNTTMESRQLGKSGIMVPELCFGTGTFGAGNEFFKAWGETSDVEARKLIDICMEAGLNFFDTADIYSERRQRRGPC